MVRKTFNDDMGRTPMDAVVHFFNTEKIPEDIRSEVDSMAVHLALQKAQMFAVDSADRLDVSRKYLNIAATIALFDPYSSTELIASVDRMRFSKMETVLEWRVNIIKNQGGYNYEPNILFLNKMLTFAQQLFADMMRTADIRNRAGGVLSEHSKKYPLRQPQAMPVPVQKKR
jgi:hypothetical protein